MERYYAEDGSRMGPVSQDALVAMKRAGTIQDDTLVWREGMSDWAPFSEAGPRSGNAGREQVATAEISSAESVPEQACRECGRFYPQDRMVPYSGSWICAECKPVFFQRIREGVAPRTEFQYGGFWIRFVAKLADGIINIGLSFVISSVGGGIASILGGGAKSVLVWLTTIFAGYIFPLLWGAFFLGRFGATPGKMLLRLKVVRPDGSGISYQRGFCRGLAEWISGLILLIGYIMAAFDEEKRTLHDRICDTRVIRK